MNFELDYQPVPWSDSPLRAAHVPWDSVALGHAVYELELEAANDEQLASAASAWLDQLCSLHQPVLVVHKLDACRQAQLLLFSQQGFVAVELVCRLELAANQLQHPQDHGMFGELREATEADLPRLQEIAGAAFRSDRFHQDRRLDPRGAELRMRNWVANSFHACEPFWVHQSHQGDILGAISFREIDPGVCVFTLAMTDPAHQATGVSITMFELAFLRWKGLGYSTALIDVSSNNPASFNVALSLGFRIQRTRVTLHWYTPVLPAG